MLRATVTETAEIASVSEKTVREWIRDEGLPTVRAGGKGPGQGAIVDMARFPAWYDRHRGQHGKSWGEAFAAAYSGRNPLRDIVMTYYLGATHVLGRAFSDWADAPAEQGLLDYRPDGITKKQARAIAYKLWSIAAMSIATYQTQKFEEHIERDVCGNLDDWLSFLTRGDFRTKPQEPAFSIPPAIREIMPPDLLAAFSKAAPRTGAATNRRGVVNG